MNANKLGEKLQKLGGAVTLMFLSLACLIMMGVCLWAVLAG